MPRALLKAMSLLKTLQLLSLSASFTSFVNLPLIATSAILSRLLLPGVFARVFLSLGVHRDEEGWFHLRIG